VADRSRVRFLVSVGLLSALILASGLLFWRLSDGGYSLFDSIYFALITISTVGYSELPRMDLHPAARLVVMGMIVAGVASVALFQSSMTTIFLEGVIEKAFRRRRMERRISALRGHTVVAGCGRTGQFVISELMAGERPFVVIDQDREALERLNQEYGGKLLYVLGDATDDASLIAAGVEFAAGLVTALTDDRDNVFVTISARSLNPRARIVAKTVSVSTEAKLNRAGANATVSPHRIGGLRLVTELLRPHTAEFLDSMMRGTGEDQLRFDDVEVRSGAPFAGRTLREAPIREQANVLIVAIRDPSGVFIYNPDANTRLDAGSYVVVLGTRTGVKRARGMLEDVQ
jgi:voltage-gated potassium channel